VRCRVALLLLASFGCGEDPAPVDPMPAPDEPEPPAEDVAEPAEPPPPSEAQAQMHDRYEAVAAIRSAFVRGDLEVAKAVARTLGPVTAELPEAAVAHRDVVPERAAALVAAEDVHAGARAFATLLEGCGSCHEAAEAAWTWETPARPEGEDLPEHMMRHLWAVDRMWEALVTHDVERFELGASALADAPLTGEDPPDHEDPPGISALARRVHARAGEASAAGDFEARAAIYGDVLASCADCHRHFADLDLAGVE